VKQRITDFSRFVLSGAGESICFLTGSMIFKRCWYAFSARLLPLKKHPEVPYIMLPKMAMTPTVAWMIILLKPLWRQATDRGFIAAFSCSFNGKDFHPLGNEVQIGLGLTWDGRLMLFNFNRLPGAGAGAADFNRFLFLGCIITWTLNRRGCCFAFPAVICTSEPGCDCTCVRFG